MRRISALYNCRYSAKHTLPFTKNVKQYSQATTSTELTEKITIPQRIPRGPTTILRALAATVKSDPTAAHYKYHDDPYLIPVSNVGKRTFAMAQEAGRKSAHWIKQQHPELFDQFLSDPPVKTYLPQAVYTEDSDVSEISLLELINSAQVSDAKTVYNLLKSKNIEISRSTMQALLELICFYNEEMDVSEEWIEERWFNQSATGKNKPRKTWKDNGLAETIFRELDPPDSASYCALIQGMTRYYHVDGAYRLYDETQKNGILLCTETFNSLIRVSSFMKEANDLRWQLIVDLLTSMNHQNIKPNIGTLNAVLEALSSHLGSKHARDFALRTLAEFKELGIEPCLATYYWMLDIFYKDRYAVTGILYDIMDILSEKELSVQDPKDIRFFVTAMEICRNILQDSSLARKIDNLLHYGNNYDLIGDSYKESIYYRHFFSLLIANESLETFISDFYNRLVPHVYIPEPTVMADILKAVEINAALSLLPRLWSDMLMFDHIDREQLLTDVLKVAVNSEVINEEERNKLNEPFKKIAWDIWTKIVEQKEERTNKISFTGSMLGDILILCLRANDFNSACEVMTKLQTEHGIVGVPKIESIETFIDHCVTNKQPSRAISAVQYCVDSGFTEAGILARNLVKSFTLSEMHLARLESIVGPDVLRTKEETVNDAS